MKNVALKIAESFCGLHPEFNVDYSEDHRVSVSKEGGGSLFFDHDFYRKKVLIRGLYPEPKNSHDLSPLYVLGREEDAPSIKVGDAVDPMKSAKRASGKVLGEYLKLYALCIEKMKESEGKEATRDALVESVFPGMKHERGKVETPYRKGLWAASVDYDHGVNMDIRRIPASLAKEIAVLLLADEDCKI